MTNRRRGRIARPPTGADARQAAAAPADASTGEVPSVQEADVRPADGGQPESLREELLESVSTDAIQTHPSEAPDQPGPAEADEPGTPDDEAPVETAAASAEASPESDVPSPAVAAQDLVDAPNTEESDNAVKTLAEPSSGPAESAAEPLEPNLPPATIAAQDLADDLVKAPAEAAMTLSDAADMATGARATISAAAQPFALSEVNATLLTFLRGEGEAALAHMRALAQVKSPADLVRLQVNEMHRAADASLTCWNDLARKAGRLAESVRRP